MPHVVLTADGSRTIRMGECDVSFHSISGAFTESRDVYLINSGVAGRLKEGLPCRVLETGFGAGLNFLLAADRAVAHGSAKLEYTAVDIQFLAKNLFADLAWGPLIDHPWLVEQLMNVHIQMTARSVSKCFTRFSIADNVMLRILRDDATKMKVSCNTFDAVFHDPFSPDVSPRLWESGMMRQLFDALRPGGVLVSYCVKSSVRRALSETGFQVSVHRGPRGGKREVLVARKELR